MSSVHSVTYNSFGNNYKGQKAERYVLESIAGMRDEDIIRSSFNYADEKSKHTFTRKFCDASGPIVNILGPFYMAAMKKGSFAQKAAVFGVSLAAFSFIKPVSEFVNKGINKLADKSPKFKEKNDSHPVMSALITSAGIVAAATLAINGAFKFADKHFNQGVSKFFTHSLPHAAKKINSTKPAAIYTKVSEKFAKYPKAANTLGFAFGVGAPLALGAGIIDAEYKNAKNISDDAYEKMSELALYRNIARDILLSDGEVKINNKD